MSEHEELSVLSAIRSIQNGTLEPTSLLAQDRRRCVEHLTGEGYSTVEIAEVLRVSQRTVARDRAAIRQANALDRDPELPRQMVGQLVGQAEAAIGRLRRIGRERQTPPAVRVEAEKTCWTISRQLIERLQSLGYLPTAPTEIRGEMAHRLEDAPSYQEIHQEVTRLQVILGEDGLEQVDGTVRSELGEMADLVSRLALGDQLDRIRQLTTNKGGEESETQDN